MRDSPQRNRRIHRDLVGRVYRDAAGNLPDFTRLDRRALGWRRWAIAGGLVTLGILAAVAWAGFLVFKPYTATTTGDVTLRIDVPPSAGLGSETTYRVTVTNGDRIPVAAASLDVRLPEDFVLIDATPAPEETRTLRWSLGTIPGHGEREVVIRGRLYGAPGTETAATASLLYRPGNFNADFQTTARSATAIGASPLALAIQGPERVVPGDAVTYTVAFEHTGDTLLPGTRLSVALPPSFTIRSVSRERLREDTPTFALGDLAPAARGTVTITGAYASGAPNPYTVHATVSVVSLGDRRVTASARDLSTHVLGGDVTVIATVNDQTTGIDARPGDALRFRIAVRNDGEDALRGVTVRAIFEATSVGERSILNFAALGDPANGSAAGEQLAPGLRRGTITWTVKEIPALAEIPRGEQRTIDFTLPMQSTDALPNFPPTARATLTVNVDIAETGEVAQPRTVRTGATEIRVKR